MDKIIESGKIFSLADLLPYEDGKVANKILVKNDNAKLIMMSFDEGTTLPEHSAHGEVLLFALEGKATIFYDEKEYNIEAGQNFKFEKGIKHHVKANGKFKMVLLMVKQ